MDAIPFRFGLPALILAVRAVAAPAGAQTEAPDDWFQVRSLDRHTYAISEPKYWQGNVSYLLLGERQALLFDTGPGVHSLSEVVTKLTKLPVLVIPSHLHFDHVGRIQEFERVGLIDLPALRAETKDGHFDETEAQLAMKSSGFSFRVTQWIRDGETLDLGGRTVQVLSTPGHTPDSVTLVDAAAKRVFSGDLICHDGIWAITAGSDLRQSAASVKRILAVAPQGSLDYEAHSNKAILPAEISLISQQLQKIADGEVPSKPVCLGRVTMQGYSIGDFPVVRSRPGGPLLEPLADVNAKLDMHDGACAAHASTSDK
jgi:glyoxylase-like metal-dependent hydrolase (beta-lactamase superfamily II)